MEVIDLNSQNGKDESCEYVDLSHAETEVYESSPLKEAMKEVLDDQRVADNGFQVSSQNIPAIGSTRAKFENLHLEQNVNGPNVLKRRSKMPESVEQRLSRIKDELEEIKAMQQTNNDFTSSGDLETLKGLHHHLQASSQDKTLELRQKLSGNRDVNNVVLPRLTINFEDSQRLLALDRRVSILERRIGLPNDEGEEYKSLTTKLEVLFRQIKLLENDSDTLGQFHERLTQVNKSYEDSLAGRRARTDAELYDAISGGMTTQETKVGELYKYHGLLEGYGPILPKLLRKIKEINAITDKIRESHEIASSLNSSVMDLQSQANKWENILTVLDQKLDQQVIDMEKNASYTNRKLAQLEAIHKD